MKTFEVDWLRIPIEITKNRQSKKMSLRVKGGIAKVVIPYWTSYNAGLVFVHQQKNWILESAEKMESDWLPESANYKKDKERARDLVENKLDYWNQFYEFEWGRIAIRDQSTRWGSCSSKGNLNFNWKILYLPNDLADYLIVHELSHLKEPNHSKRFWDLVAKSIDKHKKKSKTLRTSYSL